MGYRIAADIVLVIHAAFVAFVVIGLLLITLGLLRRWSWVRSFWFRVGHLAAIVIVVLQSWLGILCPLTTLENHLREAAGQEGYAGTFVSHWLHRVMFYEFEPWVFTVIYTLFAALVVLTWVLGRPRRPGCRDLPRDTGKESAP